VVAVSTARDDFRATGRVATTRDDVPRGLAPRQRRPDPEIIFGSGSIEDALAKAHEAADGRNVGIFGANVARQVIAAGVLDDIVAHVVPVLPGDGVRLYGSADPVVKLRR
jgi:dihydrofolate reductase